MWHGSSAHCAFSPCFFSFVGFDLYDFYVNLENDGFNSESFGSQRRVGGGFRNFSDNPARAFSCLCTGLEQKIAKILADLENIAQDRLSGGRHGGK